MIQLPEPAKLVLHLPQLEANRFNQLQTRHWRPGDQSILLGSLSNKSVPCTSQRLIRRILMYTNLPYLDQTNINVQQLFSIKLWTRSEHINHTRRSQRISIIHYNRPGSRKMKLSSHNPAISTNPPHLWSIRFKLGSTIQPILRLPICSYKILVSELKLLNLNMVHSIIASFIFACICF
ncbi:hypothetical protein YC2023_010424 [Brassica napus]